MTFYKKLGKLNKHNIMIITNLYHTNCKTIKIKIQAKQLNVLVYFED